MNNNEHQILMSPLLEKKFSDIDKKFDKILNLLEENSKRWDENKKIYVDFLEKNNQISNESMQILKDNRKMYLEALNNIQDTEKKELLPILTRLQENNEKIMNNNSVNEERYNNLLWRSQRVNLTTVRPPLYLQGLGLGLGQISNIVNNFRKDN